MIKKLKNQEKLSKHIILLLFAFNLSLLRNLLYEKTKEIYYWNNKTIQLIKKKIEIIKKKCFSSYCTTSRCF